MKNKPLRKCVGCNKTLERQDLIRILKENSTSNIIIEPNNKQFGRSAYLCKKEGCLQNAIKKKRLEKSLRISLEPSVLEEIQKIIFSSR